MTRGEEIIEAANKYSEYEYNESTANNGFIKGAKWADENPKSPWINVEESLPKEDPKRNDYMSVEVLTITDKGYISLDTYDYQTQRWFIHSEFLVVDENDDSLGEVTYWMPVPELPK